MTRRLFAIVTTSRPSSAGTGIAVAAGAFDYRDLVAVTSADQHPVIDEHIRMGEAHKLRWVDAAAGKLSKIWWVAILGVAAAVGFVTISRVLGLGIIGVVAAGVYLADVRPALRSVSGRRGGGTHSGPYGPW